MSTAPYDARAAAHQWRVAGCTTIPIRPDRSKAPAAERWRDLYPAPAVVDTDHLFATAVQQHGTQVGVAVLTGTSSGGLELLEIEGPPQQAAALMRQLGDLAGRAGLGELWQRLAGGYVESSPKGGVHFLYRLTDGPVPGNTKLARRPALDVELNDAERRHVERRPGHIFGRTTIETRGQGGYVIVAPTPAECSGADGPAQPWSFLAGQPHTIPAITSAERGELHNLARACDTMPGKDDAGAEVGQQLRMPLPQHTAGDTRPGDRYAAETPWANILQPHGWRRLWENGGKTYWCRPGKSHGVSATTTDTGPGDPGGMWVFSSSTTFDTETLYTKFGAYAHLEHGGDMVAAARALAGVGTENVVPLRPLPGPAAGASPHPAPGPAAGPASPAKTTPDPPAALPAAAPAPGVVGPDGGPIVSAPPVDRRPTWLGRTGAELTAVLDGTWQQPRAELLPVNGGHGLLYRGRTHSFYGESGSGKSMVAQAECARILRDTLERVAYVDYESDMPTVVRRLFAMGAPREKIENGLIYIKPELTPYAIGEAETFQMLLGTPLALVVIDGVTDALMYEQMKFGGPGIDQNTLVTGWARRVLDPIAQYTGAAVVTIDHVTKNSEGKTAFAIGAQAKRSVLSGAAYAVEVWDKQKLGRGKIGRVSLRPTKDRDGGIEIVTSPSGATELAAIVTFDSLADDGTIGVTVDRPTFNSGESNRPGLTPFTAGGEARKQADRDGALMAEICVALAGIPGQVALSVVDLAERMGWPNTDGSRGTELRRALDRLAFGGHIVRTKGARNSVNIHLKETYRYQPDGDSPSPSESVLDGLPDGLGRTDGHTTSSPSVSPSDGPYVVEGRRTDGRTDGVSARSTKLTDDTATAAPASSPTDTHEATTPTLAAAEPDEQPATPIAPPVFLAPAAPLAAAPSSPPGRLTRRRPDEVLCPCGEAVDPGLVAQDPDRPRHFGCEDREWPT
jgi:hypothetical protein